MRAKRGGLFKRCDCDPSRWGKCAHAWWATATGGGRRVRLDLARWAGAPERSILKTEAEAIRHEVIAALRAGTFSAAGRMGSVLAGLRVGDGPTVGDVATLYRAQFVQGPFRRPHARESMNGHLDMMEAALVPSANGRRVPFAQLPIRAVSKADVEAIRTWRREHFAEAQAAARTVARLVAENRARKRGQRVPVPRELLALARLRTRGKGGEVGINRLLARVRHFFNWAIAEGYCDASPFKRHGVTVVKLETRAETERPRRLEGDEESRLLAVADVHLRAVVIAALSTGCRVGELLSLQWRHVRRDDHDRPVALALEAERTKTNALRVLPIGQRLAAVLTMRETAPDGERHAADRYVFGNEVGDQVLRIDRAWRTACRRAGIVGLHFHDLRREFGCRLLETDAALHDVREFLGHANISTTSRYLRSSTGRLEGALRRLEAAQPSAPEELGTKEAQPPETSARERDDEGPEVLVDQGVEMVPRARIELATLRFSDRSKRGRSDTH